jgi:hypothetical protein
MASKSPDWADKLLLLVFNNTPVLGVGDSLGLLGSTGAGSLYVSLHTGDPSVGVDPSDQTTAEISYTGYGRVAVARSVAGWTVTLKTVSPVAPIIFPTSAGGTGGVATHFGIGTQSTWVGGPLPVQLLLYSGPIVPTILVVTGIAPTLTTATATTEA